MKQPTNKPQLKVIARAPFNVYYEGNANSVTASNRIGQFDVLPKHADFFSILNPGEILIETDNNEPVSFNINNGIITVRNDEVMLFVNI